ncbi:hypothetical protein SKDZ_02G1690 [Saccharomyces kudriavzevii ZP591]|nr:hypothetical protein SKDZ_02G1690 [Saccharomyces kudriavzevii ZP591]
MEKFGLKSAFPYEYGSDFKMTRLKILNSTKCETEFLFSNIKRIMLSVWKYSYTLLSFFLDSTKLIMNDVITISSRDFATKLQIGASQREDQEDILASTILMGMIIGYSISFGRKSAFFKRHRNPTEMKESSSKPSGSISIVINFMEDNLTYDDDFIHENVAKEFMISQLDDSVLNIQIPNTNTSDKTDRVFEHDILGEYDPFNGETATGVLVPPYQSNAGFKALTNDISPHCTRRTLFGKTEGGTNERIKVVEYLTGDDEYLLHDTKQRTHKSNAVVGRFFVQDNTASMSEQLRNIPGPVLVMNTWLGDELFLTMFDEESSFFSDSVPIKKIGPIGEKQELFEVVSHRELICYDKNRSLNRIYNLPNIEKQEICFKKDKTSRPSKKSLMNGKDAASILLWYSTHL